jgi:hypothetical protein
LAWQCERWHALPKSGGMMLQDYETMHHMAACLNIYNAVTHLRNARGEQIHGLTDGERRILRLLVDMGLLFNG